MKVEECKKIKGRILDKNEIIFAYSMGNTLDALIILKEKKFIQSEGEEFKKINRMFNLKNGVEVPILFDATYTRLGPDRCLWFAKIQNYNQQGTTIYSSHKIDLNFQITLEIEETFYKLNKNCVDQGDPPENKKPPCTKPTLIATSDLNSNNRFEFWYIAPYIWGEGFTIAEVDLSKKLLKSLAYKCFNCD